MSDRFNIRIPELALVVLIGPSGGGKSTFAARHFLPTEVISSDTCRALVSDDPNNQAATGDAFDVLHYIAGKRLAAGKLTVIDATNVRREDRTPLVALAREHDVLPVALVLNTPQDICDTRNLARPDRQFGRHVVRNHLIALRRSLRGLEREGFRNVAVMHSPEQVDNAVIERQKLWTDRRDDRGPFDIVGDVHGCYDELLELLAKLDYDVRNAPNVVPPAGRKVIFLGDLVDRGPKSGEVLELVWTMVEHGHALCVPGNHDAKLLRALQGRSVQRTHGLEETMIQLAASGPEFMARAKDFVDRLISHYVLDAGALVVAHAGMKQAYIGRASRRVREFALYGETTGESDEFGLPERIDWARDYRGDAVIAYGHTPVPQSHWPLTVVNNTINLDTGCCFGGRLSALRWPEREVVSVEAHARYAEPARPIADVLSDAVDDDLLDLGDVTGKRFVETRLGPRVTVRAENAAAALEVMSRYAVDPRWLVYLPPTMSPPTTSARDDVLEHPAEAFAYYRDEGVKDLVCQAKHMGSRAVVIVCRDDEVATRRFGVASAEAGGIIYTRTGRRFFETPAVEADLLERVRQSLTTERVWDELATDWLVMDCELMPWSAKAQDLLKSQYAAVGSVASGTLAAAEGLLRAAVAREGEKDEALSGLLSQTSDRLKNVSDYITAYRRYCWPVNGVGDLRLAPFQLLAGEGHVFSDQSHIWHMDVITRLTRHDSALMSTEHIHVNLDDTADEVAATKWWEDYTDGGGEGMVVKPNNPVTRSPRGLVQPAMKVRGREYLRIIYGPTYTENLSRLRSRATATKRSLAVREFALGLESLHRFVERKPLRQVHECVFGVLAMESEPVDPRL